MSPLESFDTKKCFFLFDLTHEAS